MIGLFLYALVQVSSFGTNPGGLNLYANNPVECFNRAGNYGNPADLTRGQGENESIIQMVDYEVAHHSVDTTRVYVAGFSAGAAFTAVLLATWPARFAAGAILEGIPYHCATDV